MLLNLAMLLHDHLQVIVETDIIGKVHWTRYHNLVNLFNMLYHIKYVLCCSFYVLRVINAN